MIYFTAIDVAEITSSDTVIIIPAKQGSYEGVP
jgi:hypothetical protein